MLKLCLICYQFARIVKIREDQLLLPISNYRYDILNTISEKQVVVVVGDTGCGKSTQVPQYMHHGILDERGQSKGLGYEHIAVTQPRRIACINLASRVSTEMLCEKNTKVGYQVRFGILKKVSPYIEQQN